MNNTTLIQQGRPLTLLYQPRTDIGDPEGRAVREVIREGLFAIYNTVADPVRGELEDHKKELLWYLLRNDVDPFAYVPINQIKQLWVSGYSVEHILFDILRLYRSKSRTKWERHSSVLRSWLHGWKYTRITYCLHLVEAIGPPPNNPAYERELIVPRV